MKRRAFLGMAVAGAAAGLARPALAHGAESAGSATALAQPQLLTILRDEAVVRALGRHYRALTPAEDGFHALVQAIAGEPVAAPDLPLATRIAEQVRRDFATGRTITLEGWVLSRTEARQCALFSLLPA